VGGEWYPPHYLAGTQVGREGVCWQGMQAGDRGDPRWPPPVPVWLAGTCAHVVAEIDKCKCLVELTCIWTHFQCFHLIKSQYKKKQLENSFSDLVLWI